ncbi:hypothetical protein QUH73_20510 [Labilibaculum sp. K2S]|uniref:hypothetical protein n=1 Tax=Labilibaculum sp. K2S TaxID=3056386 RepID=UPI0025A4589B|nr:hypothetical protein [Labilibaculum sp. K2S]MDM8162208.1 hypothetical protein [Labilibaculum sp. K2S]
MSDTETISWIFLAIAFASEKEPSDFNGITKIADGINHAVPTQKEMQSSIKWLLNNDLIVKIGKKYSLTDNGIELVNNSRLNETGILNMWKNLEQLIKNI